MEKEYTFPETTQSSFDNAAPSDGFSFPLFSVLIAFLLAYVPHVWRVIIARGQGKYDNTNPRATEQFSELSEDQASLQRRLMGAHNNQLESIGVYASGVVANVARDKTDWKLITLCALYLAFRVCYILAYAGPQFIGGYLRSLVFLLCIIVLLLLWILAFV